MSHMTSNNKMEKRPFYVISEKPDGTNNVKRIRVETSMRIDDGNNVPQRIRLIMPEKKSTSTSITSLSNNNNNNNNSNDNLQFERRVAKNDDRDDRDSMERSPVEKDQKRVLHREIERKRRDRINDWIMTLAQKVPSCKDDHTKQGQSKSGILAKTSTYIDEMKMELERLQEESEELIHVKAELHDLRHRCMRLESENEAQKSALEKNNIVLNS